jgi:hypothetical protein
MSSLLQNYVLVVFMATGAGAVATGSGALGTDNKAITPPPGVEDLRWSAYITARSVQKLAAEEATRQAALPVLRGLSITKVYLEVYRSGLVVSREGLERVRDFFVSHGYPAAAGIATVPGGDFGVRADTGLTWFNWQNPKTQHDLIGVVRTAAEVFDEFIVDDFLCTGDTSPESDAARAGRSWSEYRRDLLTRLSSEVFLDPAREVNPKIRMIIKYPQWYDRFHLFGYDVERKSRLFDQVWVGTETRGARTQRFGFTQPYEGFVNYRWLGSVAGDKLGGAWFDHGDCDALDFVDQAWQTVTAGAGEIILFNYGNLAAGHPGHALLRRDFDSLTDLARVVREHPVVGTAAYKPPSSDAGGDLYLMDSIGMLGIPLVPCARFPEESAVVVLPTQAAADPGIEEHITDALNRGQHLVFTAGFLATIREGRQFARLAGLREPVSAKPQGAERIQVKEGSAWIEPGLRLHADLEPGVAKVILAAEVNGRSVPFLTEHSVDNCRIVVLNTHTYSQEDFDAVGEVLLPPTPLGLLEIPEVWAGELRRVFGGDHGLRLRGPTRVTLQPLDGAGWLIQNYNDSAVSLELEFPEPAVAVREVLSGQEWPVRNRIASGTLPARSRWWIRPSE